MSDPASTGPTADFDSIAALRAGTRKLILVVLLALAGSVAYALLAPKWYRAELVVVPSAPPQRGGLSMLGGGAGGVAGALGGGLDLPIEMALGQSEVERIGAVLHSNSVSDAVISKFKLTERYKERYIEDTREELWRNCNTRAEKKPGTVTLTCEDKDPAVAQAMAAFFGEHGNLVFRRVSRSTASEERRFLEKRVGEARTELTNASRALREFQEKNKVVDLPEQARGVVTAMATLRADLLSKQVQLAYLEGFSTRDEASAMQLRRQVAVLQGRLRALEEDHAATEAAATTSQPAAKPKKKSDERHGLFPTASAVPNLRFQYEQLAREQKIQETLFVMLTQRHETARVQEARDTSTFQVLDWPSLPTKRVRPKRGMIVLGGLIAGLILGLAWVLVPPWYASLQAYRRESSADRRGAGGPAERA